MKLRDWQISVSQINDQVSSVELRHGSTLTKTTYCPPDMTDLVIAGFQHRVAVLDGRGGEWKADR